MVSAATSEHTTSYQRAPRLFIHLAKYNDEWKLEISLTTSVLVIGDSNLKNATSVPKDCEVHSLSGGRLEHAEKLMSKLPESSKLRIVILHLGMNHRDDANFPTGNLKAMQQSARHLGARLLVQGVSVALEMPREMKRDLCAFNDKLHEIWGSHYI